MSEECIFCKIAAKEIPGDLVYEDDEIVAFRDIAPKAPTHIVIIPRLHVPTVNDLESEHALLVGKMFLTAKRLAAEEKIDRNGYRLVFNCNAAAGQTVWHIHLHLLGGRIMEWPPG